MQSRLAAGTTLKYTASLAAYPASAGWVLRYRLAVRTGSGTPIDLTCTASGDDHQLTVAYATTAAWAPGTYNVAAFVERAGERFEVPEEAGTLVVTPDPAAITAGVETRSQAEVALAAVQSLLAGKASSGVESYEVAGRQLKSYPLPDLIKLEAKLKAQVNAEAVLAGKAAPYPSTGIRRILTRVVA